MKYIYLPLNRLAIFVLCFVLTGEALAEDGASKDAASPPQQADVYARPFDALTGEPLGDSPLKVTLDGRELRFATKANAETFNKAPADALAKLDAAMVAEQVGRYPLNTCVITGEKIGEMGTPVDVIVNNRLFRLCCNGCVKQVKQKPAAAFEKLNAAVIAAQNPAYPLKTCLVMKDDALESDAIDYVVANRLVRFCCTDCLAKFEKEPLKYLPALDAAAKK